MKMDYLDPTMIKGALGGIATGFVTWLTLWWKTRQQIRVLGSPEAQAVQDQGGFRRDLLDRIEKLETRLDHHRDQISQLQTDLSGAQKELDAERRRREECERRLGIIKDSGDQLADDLAADAERSRNG